MPDVVLNPIYLVRELVPRLIQSIAVQGGKEAAEKWAGRIVPVLSSAIGAGLNYMFLLSWSRRALKHFREKHIAIRTKMALGEISKLENSQFQLGQD